MAASAVPPGPGGFYGKLPARGDFVGQGLAGSFTRPWDKWWQQAIATSRDLLGPRWKPAWMEAPIWRFLLPAGACGPAAMLGLWMPSVDRAGRLFPLTFARPAEGHPAGFAAAQAGWLALAEAAGLAALELELGPAELAARLAGPEPEAPPPAPLECAAAGRGETVWWTEGSPRVPAGVLVLPALPDGAAFARMLDAGAA
ncbi:type VI secretion system-associated protein TagF [Siccirubricoccus sp. KC 17139]|uniref:Type VI secretion system-associated protein TagF n=1 Tax=Siccirubricoccus soli TaxID=2899147 RepID=A0ABT1D0S5_9PROT|nr:type VI secretion system-associated protein TagF [Siccirubricoccus soli]MCO6415521.1 type VI secretion system-associated protein TagF [Siccirubricoccus soli]MCP2681653.1 type VI secretion system-associated protein TagF [Siccirubricoccus soli]